MTTKNTSPIAPASTEPIDWFLQHLVDLVNQTRETTFGVTITVGGQVISGVMIGGAEYFHLFADDMAQGCLLGGMSQDEADSIKESLASNAKTYEPSENDPGNPIYIHLKNARHFYGNGSIPSNSGMLWRGKLESVDGFSLGALSSVAS